MLAETGDFLHILEDPETSFGSDLDLRAVDRVQVLYRSYLDDLGGPAVAIHRIGKLPGRRVL